MLSQEQIDFFHENGFLRIPQVFNEEEISALVGQPRPAD